jgi:mannose-6-phosphate isomerase-like protein (cupin superfamily)
MLFRTALLAAAAAFAVSPALAQPGQITFGHVPSAEVAAKSRPADGPGVFTPAKGDNYVVLFATRNGKGNTPELHDHFADYIAILSGNATLSYGGTLKGGKLVSPGETRGGTIEGGKQDPVHAGDYIQIPAGMPHMLMPSGGELHYVVFKVRE